MRLPDPFKGHVYFVGAGPGDPGLITLKGAHYLARADVILYDDLLDPRLLDFASPTCEKVYVGKRGGRKSQAQEDINRLLVSHGKKGGVVVRLKGGDPFVFGRGGEEALVLRKAGIPFEIVSGVTAAAGVPAYAGIPLTHRGVAAVAVLVTAQEDPTRSTPAVDWPALAQLESTLVIFMGARKLAQIAQLLLDNGRSASTPVAMIEWGTWPRQRTVSSTLDTLIDAAADHDIHSPTLIIVGGVVDLRRELDWFEQKPLFGRRVLITRSREQTGDLQLLLEAHGAHVAALPMLEIGAPSDLEALDRSISELGWFQWVVFTSPNGVDYFFSRLYEHSLDARAFASASVAAVGLATAEHLRDRGVHPDLIPVEQSQEGLIRAFEDRKVDGVRFLLPGSAIARPALTEALRQRGAEVVQITAYENNPPDPAGLNLPIMTQNQFDMAVFASPSSVRNLSELMGIETTRQALADTAIACIGPTTARTVKELGLAVAVQPPTSSVADLVEAVCAYYRPPC